MALAKFRPSDMNGPYPIDLEESIDRMFPMEPEPMIRGPVVRRPATAAEAKALTHPLRMRILRLCLDRSLTNKQLAEAGPGATSGFNRLALTLNRTSREELESRVLAILDEFVTRPADPDGEPYGLLFAIHRRSLGPGPSPPAQDPGSGGVDPRS